jgi:sugar phosphate permease
MNQTLSTRRWWVIMPIVFITYSLAFLDRANFGFASAAGITQELGIGQGTSSLLGALFFLGYFAFQIPAALYAQRRSVKKLIVASLVLSGACAALTGIVSSIPALMGVRFALGIAEAMIMPALLICISNWFTKRERSRANTLLILGNPVTLLWMSVVSAYLVDTVGWRAMFLAEGVPAVAWAICWWYCMPERPSDARWLSVQEKHALKAALCREQSAIKAASHCGNAIRPVLVLKLCMQYFFWNIAVYGFVLWLPSVLKATLTIGIVSAGWLSTFPYLLAIGAMLAVSWASDRLGTREAFVWPCLAIGALAFAALYAIGATHPWLSYALLAIAGAAMYAPYGAFFALVPELLPKELAGRAMALINSMGALGSFVGSYAVGYLNGMTGTPSISYALMSAALIASVLFMLRLAAPVIPATQATS